MGAYAAAGGLDFPGSAAVCDGRGVDGMFPSSAAELSASKASGAAAPHSLTTETSSPAAVASVPMIDIRGGTNTANARTVQFLDAVCYGGTVAVRTTWMNNNSSQPLTNSSEH